MNSIEKRIALLRNAHPDNERLYMEGQCYNFALFMRELYPQAKILYSQLEGHVYTQIDEGFYDIRGRHFKVPSDLGPLDHKRGDKPHRWGKRDRRRLS